MDTVKTFKNGGSRALRLPKRFHPEEKEFRIADVGDALVIIPLKDSWERFDASVKMFSEDFIKNLNEMQKLRRQKRIGYFQLAFSKFYNILTSGQIIF